MIVKHARRWRVLLAALGGAALMLVAFLGSLQVRGNVHTVIPGELYRSATLDPARLEKLVRDNGIRTIVNLRGGRESDGWFRREASVAAQTGARLVTLHWAADREPSARELDEFFALAAGMELPALIHCRSGSDRTGLAVALYLAKITGATEEEAEDQLSLRYGHIGLPFTPAYAMDRTFERLEPSLGYLGS